MPALGVGDVLTNGSVVPAAADAAAVADMDSVIDTASFAFAAVVAVLTIGCLVVYALRYFRVQHTVVPDSWVFMAIGLLMSLLLDVDSASSHLDRVVAAIDASFSEIFFAALLPPIVFRSGYELNVTDFMRAFGAISVFAVLGTLMNIGIIGIMLWAVTQLPFLPNFSGTQALLLAASLSATDTVAVIAVFDKLRVPDALYSLVYGESVLNDAVSIVAFRTLAGFEASGAVTAAAVAKGAGMFCLNFVGSMALGALVGVLNALLFKLVRMDGSRGGGAAAAPGGSAASAGAARGSHDGGSSGLELEKALLFVTPYIAYMTADAFHLSGVVAILFCGIITGLYTVKNVTPGSRRFVTHLYRMLAMLCEALCFVYIGIALPLLGSAGMRRGWPVAILLVVLCVGARGASTAACARLVNWMRPPEAAIGKGSQVVIWMAGLRGGVAFALATAASKVVTNSDVGETFAPLALFLVLLSMLAIPASIGRVIRHFGLDAPAPAPLPAAAPEQVGDGSAGSDSAAAHGSGLAAADALAAGVGGDEPAAATRQQAAQEPQRFRRAAELLESPEPAMRSEAAGAADDAGDAGPKAGADGVDKPGRGRRHFSAASATSTALRSIATPLTAFAGGRPGEAFALRGGRAAKDEAETQAMLALDGAASRSPGGRRSARGSSRAPRSRSLEGRPTSDAAGTRGSSDDNGAAATLRSRSRGGSLDVDVEALAGSIAFAAGVAAEARSFGADGASAGTSTAAAGAGSGTTQPAAADAAPAAAASGHVPAASHSSVFSARPPLPLGPRPSMGGDRLLSLLHGASSVNGGAGGFGARHSQPPSGQGSRRESADAEVVIDESTDGGNGEAAGTGASEQAQSYTAAAVGNAAADTQPARRSDPPDSCAQGSSATADSSAATAHAPNNRRSSFGSVAEAAAAAISAVLSVPQPTPGSGGSKPSAETSRPATGGSGGAGSSTSGGPAALRLPRFGFGSSNKLSTDAASSASSSASSSAAGGAGSSSAAGAAAPSTAKAMASAASVASRQFNTFMHRAASRIAVAANNTLVRKDSGGGGRGSGAAGGEDEWTDRGTGSGRRRTSSTPLAAQPLPLPLPPAPAFLFPPSTPPGGSGEAVGFSRADAGAAAAAAAAVAISNPFLAQPLHAELPSAAAALRSPGAAGGSVRPTPTHTAATGSSSGWDARYAPSDTPRRR